MMGAIIEFNLTKRIIEKYIGPPDRLATNYHFATCPRVKLYLRTRIEQWVKDNPEKVEAMRLRREKHPLKYEPYAMRRQRKLDAKRPQSQMALTTSVPTPPSKESGSGGSSFTTPSRNRPQKRDLALQNELSCFVSH